jgi:transposase
VGQAQGKPGKDTDTVHAFFDELPDDGASLEAVSMDMGPAYAKAVRQRAPSAVICFDVRRRIMSGVVPDTWWRAEGGPLRTA